MMDKYLYYGNLGKVEEQYTIPNFIGLALFPNHDREIKHDAKDKLPFSSGTIKKIQSQDVFEHLPVECLPIVFDDIYDVLCDEGVFRLSLPDYRSPHLKQRSIYNACGEIIADLLPALRESVTYDETAQKISRVSKEGHLWFPKYEIVLDLIVKSNIRFCKNIVFYQGFKDDSNYVLTPIPENGMYVKRCYPNDPRCSNKQPLSLVFDFIK